MRTFFAFALVLWVLVCMASPILAQTDGAPASRPGGDQPGPPPGDMPPPMNDGDNGDFQIERGLNLGMVLRAGLSDEQLNRLCSEAYETLAKGNLLKAELENLRIQLSCLRRRQNVEEEDIKAVFKKKAELEAAIFLNRRQTAKIFQSILTEEQFEGLKNEVRSRRFNRKPRQ